MYRRKRRSDSFRRRNRRSGYILEQLLITLLVCAFLIPVALVLVSTLARMITIPDSYQDEVAIAQLRHVINVSSEFECNGSELSFLHHDKRQRLVLRNGNLDLIDPGTQIFLTNLSDVTFELSDERIYVTYAHFDQEPETRCLGHI
ncbi:MAG: hypothetical protein IKF60_00635 [Solobacterium sp.]|nr:hypothetical protein [Solobacterium sp.]